MRIKTQLMITAAVFGIILIAIAVVTIISDQHGRMASEQEKIAVSITQEASELGYLANDYVIYRETQQLERWQSKFASFSDDVSRLDVEDPDTRRSSTISRWMSSG